MAEDFFPSGDHPQRFASPDEDGIKKHSELKEDEATDVRGGGDLESWSDFALQVELDRVDEKKDYQI
ncbi:hypothetical protein F9B85_09665 [Heliorestis acidaminivorans]|uniref:Uncharacterized protein n=1 Tax=Heliorestis acidaminivorans TaxID=553427 RepID=A0A6I0EZK0_9FIRM|nr:hypothetical protein [Heliorestis acidaminivorans]KAB2952075.1 hypothetical protein F9B85_09665 [Heliorestis acidaminivorans]